MQHGENFIRSMTMALTPEQQSIYNEHDDIAVMLFHAVQLRRAGAAYLAHADADPVKYSTRDNTQQPNSYTKLTEAIARIDDVATGFEHWCYVRLRSIDVKNSGRM
jgi:hypothetical protein